mgnify:CR=1 FL=1
MADRRRFHLNVIGPFYVEDGCCTLCGVPDAEAPDLFAEAEGHCYVRRQPGTSEEIERMLSAIGCAELGCIRYAGDDPTILERLALVGEAAVCDSMPPHIAALRRDHVSFALGSPSGARGILARLVDHLRERGPALPAPKLTGDADRATLADVWPPEPLVLERVHPGDRWLLRGAWGGLHLWLATLPGCSDVRWYSRGAWEAGGASYASPW